MSCYQCYQSFGLLNKEHSCKICRFSFCSKCLNNASSVSNVKETKKICKKCLMAEINKSKGVFDIPKNLQKLKEMNEKKTEKSEVFDIENRLSNLRPTNNVTTEELEKRLRQLKGKTVLKTGEQNESAASQFYIKPKSFPNEVDELLARGQDEVVIDERMISTNKDRDQALEQRLTKLRSETVKPTSTDIVNTGNYLNADSVVEQIMNEIKIENKFKSSSSYIMPTEASEELPYCCLCTEDAIWKCFGCDGDLYCGSCYRKCHKKSEYGSHEHEPFKPVRK